jgi:hypothetical protein
VKSDDRDPIVERLMEGLEPPQPPSELRSRTLAAARQRMKAEEAQDVWSRLWNHRGLRLAWAVAVVVLFAGHVLATYLPVSSLWSVNPAFVADNRVDEGYIDLLNPVRISENVQPLVGLIAGSEVPTGPNLGGNPS